MHARWRMLRLTKPALQRWAWAMVLVLLAARGLGQWHAEVHGSALERAQAGAHGHHHDHDHEHAQSAALPTGLAAVGELWLGHALGDSSCVALEHGLGADVLHLDLQVGPALAHCPALVAQGSSAWAALARVAPRARDPPRA